ncbi:MAG: vitamin B12-dependent ribonucleotide reductase [Parcubacteria group bacterium]
MSYDASPSSTVKTQASSVSTIPKKITAKTGIHLNRYFTKKGEHPYDSIEWELREAKISGEEGKIIFEQKDVEFPKSWSQLATNVVVSKYFRGKINTPNRETSVKQMISRVTDTITKWGTQGGYFETQEDAEIFHAELTHLLVNQKMAFNSPVWFNVGVKDHPQCSACFILSVEDDMESILEWIRTEGMIFKGGSGSGVNLSPLRSSKETLGGGGIASGPVSFMRGADASAGAIKSGGTTRRAAKMVILNVDHPDILEFIHSKEVEEKKAWTLGEAGYDMSMNGEAWKSIQFQNANNSVRVTDEFMRAVVENRQFSTKYVTSGEQANTYNARDMLTQIAEATWVCGDPGLQYDTTINAWHTCPNTGRINGSNPCSEYMHLDNSACNLASINLMNFLREDDSFDVRAFKKAVDITILAQEILVGFSSYPTPAIEQNAKDYRELGLGYANLGALLMSWGLPYDSDAGRAVSATITALMTGEAYAESARISEVVGPFAGYEKNREPMLNVIAKHKFHLDDINRTYVPQGLFEAAEQSWTDGLQLGQQHGIRNSQVSVLAPTGTISFLMDCDTTGVEPDIALVKYKNLVGGGVMKIVNKSVPKALQRLGYSQMQVDAIIDFINEKGTIEGAPGMKDEHLSIFDCAFKPINGQRFIHYRGHIKMMGAVQPFISGAISKTVNLPKEAVAQDIIDTYIESWKLGLKALAIYRDGSKRTQPLSMKNDDHDQKSTAAVAKQQYSVRRRLPDERKSITHKFTVAGHEGYITVGLYDDGKPGEVFITMAKEGSTISGLMDALATVVSVSLQYGVPLKTLVNKFSHMRFEPSGFTGNPDIPIAKSILDYIFRWLGRKFLPHTEHEEATKQTVKPLNGNEEPVKMEEAPTSASDEIQQQFTFSNQEDAPACSNCGSIMVRNAACYKCMNCGATSGCS